MSKKTKRIIIITASILLLLLLVVTILICYYFLFHSESMARYNLGLLLLLMIVAFSPDNRPPVTEEFSSYSVCDSLLVCIESEDASSRWSRDEYPEWSFYYHDVPGHSDDQLVWARMTPPGVFPSTEYHVLQNPDNSVDVWTDWTIQEIQIYTSTHPITSEERFETINSDLPVVTTITDPDCLAELLTFVTSDESRPLSSDSINGLSVWKTTYIYVRVIFNESDSIVWDTQLSCYQNTETGERYFAMYKDTTEWDTTEAGLGIDRSKFWVENLPNLEAFLLDAVETLMEDLDNG